MIVTKIKKFYSWIDLKTKKLNCSCGKSLWPVMNVKPARGVCIQLSKLTIVTWYSSTGCQTSSAAMTLSHICICLVWETRELFSYVFENILTSEYLEGSHTCANS